MRHHKMHGRARLASPTPEVRRSRVGVILLLIGWGSHLRRHRERRADMLQAVTVKPDRATCTCVTSGRFRRASRRSSARYEAVLVPEINIGSADAASCAASTRTVNFHLLPEGARASPSRTHDILEQGRQPAGSSNHEHDHQRSDEAHQAKDLQAPIRKCAGAPAAATTPSSTAVQASRSRRWGIDAARHRGHGQSGIGCSSPLPVLHEHVRVPLDPRPRARRSRPGIKMSNPDLSVWLVDR